MNWLQVAVFAVLVGQLTLASVCPNDCSSNGQCSQGVCNCNQGYTGTDCSIPLTALTSGQSVTGSVSTFGWNYYTVNVQYRGGALNVFVNQTGTTGDCDVYLQINALPTRSSYAYRDITTGKNVVVRVSEAQTGTWYIGIYGFSSCSYTLQSFVLGSCPNDCSSHGQCMNGVCSCDNGYSGTDCSQNFRDLALGATVNGTANSLQMNVYRVSLTTGNYLSATLSQTTTGDCDLYVRFNSVPTVWSWDYSNVTRKNISTVVIEDARTGTWYVGVYGYQACSYTLLVSSSSQCPNQCSTHGTCSGSTCQCNSGYSGDYCQQRTAPLAADEIDTGFVEYNTWNYFVYHSNSDNNMVIYVNQTSTGDCDLFVRAGVNPTRFQYDYQDISTKASFSLSINDPGDTNWNIGIYGWARCSYKIWVDETSSCPGNCNSHGSCEGDGTCVCQTGWSGDACDIAAGTLVSGQAVLDQVVDTNQWAYYSINVVNTSAVHVIVKEFESTGFVWVYIAKGVPSLRNYLQSDMLNSGLHILTLPFAEDTTDTYQIGVYGNPYSIETTKFSIVAWYPNYSASDSL